MERLEVDIDFGRAAELMDVVQKVASVTPAYTALSSAALAELKEMNDEAQEALNDLGKRRLKAEQEAAIRLSEHNQASAEEQAKIDAEVAQRTKASRSQSMTVMSGEPVPQKVRQEAGELDGPENDPEPHTNITNAPVKRRT